MTSRPARPRTLLDFINRPILKGVAPAGNLKRVFTGKSGQNRKKNFGRVMYASETIQNCKNPTGHIDTLKALQMEQKADFSSRYQCQKQSLLAILSIWTFQDKLILIHINTSGWSRCNLIYRGIINNKDGIVLNVFNLGEGERRHKFEEWHVA